MTEGAVAGPGTDGPGADGPGPTPAPAPAGGWRTAVVRELAHPRPDAVVIRLAVPDRVDHLPGQHYVVRLTAEDGYRAQRSYSVASAPSDPLLELYVERLPDGEVSGFLADELRVGDALEVRGPIGGWFVWSGDGPATGVGGGTGVVPLVAMLRHALAVGRPQLLRLVAAARTLAGLPYAGELAEVGAVLALSREDRPGRPAGRLGAADLGGSVPAGGHRPVFVCGSAGFADAATELSLAAGADAADIRVERFGPTG